MRTSTHARNGKQQVDKTLAAVHERLVKEIYYQQDLLEKVRRDVAAGKRISKSSRDK